MPRRNKQLVTGFLENLHRVVLEEHLSIIKKLAGKQPGVYALYKRGKLYYVGLAKDLPSRVRAHLRDKHGKSWDTFRLYLTLDKGHMKELESLLIRITNPDGNRQSGRFARAKNLSKDFKREYDTHSDHRLESLFGPRTRAEARATRLKRRAEREAASKNTAAGLVERTIHVRWSYKGQVFKGRFRKDGQLRTGGKLYESPSAAASTLAGRPIDGWSAWKYQHLPGAWQKLRHKKRQRK